MLRKFKYFLLSFIFFICSFMPCFYSFAQGSEWTDSEKTKFFAEGFYKIVTDIVGLILPTGLGGQDLQNDYKNYVLNNEWIQNNLTYDEWIASQITGAYINGSSGNSDISFSADLQNSLIQWSSDWISENAGFIYGYSLDVNNSQLKAAFNDLNDYNALVSFVNSHSDSIIQMANAASINSSGLDLYIFNTEPFFVKTSIDNLGRIRCNDYALVNNNYNLIYGTTYSTKYHLDINTDSVVDVTNGNIVSNSYLCKVPTDNGLLVYYPPILSKGVQQYVVYNSLSALQSSSEGVQGYYVTDSFNSNTVTDSYNTTTTDVNNSITYGDVQNYVNNYYVENNEYPTTNVVYNYINNYVPSDNGGGSGDNGGGSGSNIFDFLGTVGDFLGNLIEGIGNVLSGILSAITDVIDMFIGENGLPNVIGQLISYFLPFLPEWIPTVIGLSVLLALLIGIVKLIRGS